MSLTKEERNAKLDEAVRLSEELGLYVSQVFPTSPRTPEEEADSKKRMEVARAKVIATPVEGDGSNV